MGFFSWETQDTGESIPNRLSHRPTFPVYLHDHEGNVWREDDYEGYGNFGGQDFYEVLARMNGLEGRDAGLSLAFANPPKPYLSPNLSRSERWKWENRSPEGCSAQGYFYDGGV